MITELIKWGCPSTTIEITIGNDGYYAFQPKEYGKFVTVVRHINASGGSSYKIKNDKGAVISKSAKDLDIMMRYMNIQVDNPICVLNQEHSRSFLKDTDDRKRFDLFAKASQIEAIDSDLHDCKVSYEACEIKLRTEYRILKIKKDDVNKISEKYRKYMSAETLREKIKDLNDEIVWINIRNMEASIETINKRIKEDRSEVERLENERKSRDTFIVTIKNSVKEHINQLKSTNEEMIQIRGGYDQHRSSLNEIKEQVMNQRGICNKIKSQLTHKLADIAAVEESLSTTSNTQQIDIENMKNNNDDKITRLQEESHEIEIIAGNGHRDIALLGDTLEGKQNNLDNLISNRTSITNKISQIDRQVSDIDTKNNNRLAVYGHQMPNFLNDIEAEFKRGKFDEMPRGPIGRYVAVTNSEYQPMVEKILGSILTSFVCHSSKDARTLSAMYSRRFQRGSNISIITTKFSKRVHCVTKGKVDTPPGTICVYDALKVSDPVVENCLIDQVGVESMLMTESSDIAQRCCVNTQNVPRNLKKIYVLKPSCEYYPAPNYRTYGIRLSAPKYLQTNVRMYVQQMKNEQNDLKSQLVDVDRQIKEIKISIKEIQEQIRDKKKKISSLDSKISYLKNEINDIRAFEYPRGDETDVLVCNTQIIYFFLLFLLF